MPLEMSRPIIVQPDFRQALQLFPGLFQGESPRADYFAEHRFPCVRSGEIGDRDDAETVPARILEARPCKGNGLRNRESGSDSRVISPSRLGNPDGLSLKSILQGAPHHGGQLPEDKQLP